MAPLISTGDGWTVALRRQPARGGHDPIADGIAVAKKHLGLDLTQGPLAGGR